MTTVAELSQKVRVALSVSGEYEGSTIPHGIRRVMRRLLRDYNFPKSVRRLEIDASVGDTFYNLPTGFKRPLEVRFQNKADNTWTNRLERREGFSLRPSDWNGDDALYGRHYWQEGGRIYVDTPMPVADLTFTMWYQSMALDAFSEDWLVNDVEDLIFSSSTMRLAAELRKPEVMQTFAPLVAEEMQSIAIYANELEWNGVEVGMREPRGLPTSRYPAGPAV